MSPISGINTKFLKLTTILLLSPLFFFAQTLTGLWSGAMSNDSTTTRKDQSFEIALTEYKGKVYGYSCSEFIVNDTLFYIVKRVKGTIVGDVCEVTDDEIIAYNFRGKLDKGVKVTSTFRRNNSDSTWYLEGTWKTNATKRYYSVTGKVGLKEENDMAMSKLFPHLEELNLANDVAFYKEKKEAPFIVKIAKPEKIKPEYTEKTESLATKNEVAIVPAQPTIQKVETDHPIVSVNKRGDEQTRPETKTILPASVELAPSSVNKTIAESGQTLVSINKQEPLTKTENKNIAVSAVSITPSPVDKTIAEQQGLASINKQEALTKTENKNITVAAVSITPAPVDKTITEQQGLVSINKQTDIEPEKTKTKNIPSSSTNIVPAAVNKPVTTKETPTNKTSTAAVTKTVAKQDPLVVKTQQPSTKQPEAVVTKPQATTAVVNKPAEIKPVIIAAVENKKTDAELIKPAALIEGRKSEFSQIVNFKSDSLVLALYDNGEIDGDTVSVFMNGEVLMAKQGLKSKAIRKTIYITPGNEDFTLVLFADNLGKYPPNTGLLVVHDGDDVYNLRFSSDMQKSSGIVFRKKEK